MMNSATQFCTFQVHGHLFGIDVRQVQEVLREVKVTPVPLAARAISGLFSLRGQNVVVIDLRRCLGFPDRAASLDPVSLIVRDSNGPISLLADEIGDVLEPDPKDFESTTIDDRPETRQVAGVYKLPDALLRVLDVSATVAHVMSQRLENVVQDSKAHASQNADSDTARR